MCCSPARPVAQGRKTRSWAWKAGSAAIAGLQQRPCMRSAPRRCDSGRRAAPQDISPAGRAMPASRSPSLRLLWLLSALATSLLHLCVVNKNNLQVVGSRQSDPRDSSHRRGFVSKATSCLLAAKGHGNEGSLWKMNSSMTTTTKICWGAYQEGRGEKGVLRGGRKEPRVAAQSREMDRVRFIPREAQSCPH